MCEKLKIHVDQSSSCGGEKRQTVAYHDAAYANDESLQTSNVILNSTQENQGNAAVWLVGLLGDQRLIIPFTKCFLCFFGVVVCQIKKIIENMGLVGTTN